MKKIIFGLIISVALLSLVFVNQAGAKVERVVSPWDLTGSYTIELTCTSGCSGVYPHTMDVTSTNLETGDFSGNGHYNPNQNYTWDVSGNVSESSLDFVILYTGSNSGYTVEAIGSIDSDGQLSGTASSSNQTFNWESTTGAVNRFFEGNHGQYVKEQENKKEAAQSRIGMPLKSKGHTK